MGKRRESEAGLRYHHLLADLNAGLPPFATSLPSLSAIAPRFFVFCLPLSRSPPCRLALLALALPLPALRRPYYSTPQIACIGASAGRPRLLLSVADSVAVACARQLGVIEECGVCYFIGTPRRRRSRREAAAGVTGGWLRGFYSVPLAWCHWHWHCGGGREGVLAEIRV